MTVLDRYFGKRLVGAMARILFSLVALIVLVDLLTHRQDNIVKYNIPPLAVAQYYLAYIPTVLIEFQAVALSVLLGALMVLGRAAQDNEVTAALAGGISLGRVARIPVLIAALTAIGLFAFQETWGVRGTAAAERIESEYFRKANPDTRSGVSWANLEDREDSSLRWTCHVTKFNRVAMTGEEVYIYALEGELGRVIEARRIFWEPEQQAWILEDAERATFVTTGAGGRELTHISQGEAPFNESPSQLFALEEPHEGKTANEFANDLKEAAAMGAPVGRYLVDYHAKFARPALCFVMIWLAIPFALRVRRGGVAIGFGVSITIALAYLLLFYICMGMGHWEMLPPIVAAWLPNVLFLGAGAWMFHHTPT